MLSEVNATAFTVPLLGLGSLLLINSTRMPGALDRVTGSALGQTAVLVSPRPLHASASSSSAASAKIDV